MLFATITVTSRGPYFLDTMQYMHLWKGNKVKKPRFLNSRSALVGGMRIRIRLQASHVIILNITFTDERKRWVFIVKNNFGLGSSGNNSVTSLPIWKPNLSPFMLLFWLSCSVGDPNDFFRIRIRILVYRSIRIRIWIRILSAPDPNPNAFGFGFGSEWKLTLKTKSSLKIH